MSAPARGPVDPRPRYLDRHSHRLQIHARQADVIVGHAPDLQDAHRRAAAYLSLDGTLIPVDQVAVRIDRGNHAWYSGKHRAFGGDAQVLAGPSEFPLWVSRVRPGSDHDPTAARDLVLPTLYPHTALRPGRMAVLADKGGT